MDLMSINGPLYMTCYRLSSFKLQKMIINKENSHFIYILFVPFFEGDFLRGFSSSRYYYGNRFFLVIVFFPPELISASCTGLLVNKSLPIQKKEKKYILFVLRRFVKTKKIRNHIVYFFLSLRIIFLEKYLQRHKPK